MMIAGALLAIAGFAALDDYAPELGVFGNMITGRIAILSRDIASCPVYDAITPGKYVTEFPATPTDCSIYIGSLWVLVAALLIVLRGAQLCLASLRQRQRD